MPPLSLASPASAPAAIAPSVPGVQLVVLADDSRLAAPPASPFVPLGSLQRSVDVTCFDQADPGVPVSSTTLPVGTKTAIDLPVFSPTAATVTARCELDLLVQSTRPPATGTRVAHDFSLQVLQIRSGDAPRACHEAADCLAGEACGMDDLCAPSYEGAACAGAHHCADPFPICGPDPADPFADTGRCQDGSAGDACGFDHDCRPGGSCNAGSCEDPDDLPPVGDPIRATFFPALFTTVYEVPAYFDVEGNPLTYTWSRLGTICGSATLGPETPPKLSWAHPSPACAHDTEHLDTTIRLDVSDGVWTVRCEYAGARSGTGPKCRLVEWYEP